MLRGDEGQRGFKVLWALELSGYSPWLTQPDEPLGYVKAYSVSVSAVMPECVSQFKKSLPRISKPEPQKINTKDYNLDYSILG